MTRGFWMGTGGASHPSETRLDELHWGELTPQRAGALQAHVARCLQCQGRLALRQVGFDAFDHFDPILARWAIEAEVRRSLVKTTKRQLGLRPLGLAGGGLLAVALLVGLGIGPGDRGNPEPWQVRPVVEDDSIRSKGELRLRVFLRDGGGVREAASGESFAAGAQLRFGVSAPGQQTEAISHAMIVGIEAGGEQPAVYFPMDGEQASTRAKVDAFGLLPGAVELDQFVGEEWLFLVLCGQPFTRADLRLGSRSGMLVVPDGCAVASFLMVKR